MTALQPGAPAYEIKDGICGVCPAGCGVKIHLQGGRIDRLSPLPGHPQGIVCPRGLRAADIVYSPDRLLYPQQRDGARGEGRFRRVTWDQAYAHLVERLREVAARYGPEAVCMYTGRGNFEFGLNEAFAPSGTVESSANAVLFPFGSPNTTGVGALCYAAYGMIASRATFGGYMRDVREDLEQADLVLIWGANPSTDSSPIQLQSLQAARQRGARLIAIDHRHSETARAVRAEWIGIRPGTDGALALALIRVLLAEGLYDREFAENWTHGFEALSAYVQAYPPERVESITGVPAERIAALARQIAAARGCSIVTYTGLEYSNSGVQAIRAVLILQALAGHLDVPGGKLFAMPGGTTFKRSLTPPPRGGRPPIGAQAYPLYYEVRNEAHASLLPEAILEGWPYPIRALIVSGSSLLTAWPNPDLWRRALAALDFLVVVDRFPTADSRYADLILPATTHFEIESYVVYEGRIQLRERVIEPLGEARSDYLIFAELAQRLGYGERWPQSEAGMIARALEGTGISLEALRAHPQGVEFALPAMRYRKYATGELRPDGRPGFPTQSGKFEVESEWLRGHGYEPLPVYTEPQEGPLANPALAERFPLVMNSGARTQSAFRSQHINIPALVNLQPRPLVHLHPQDARARGIADGDRVRVRTVRGEAPFWACVREGIVPGVVEVNMGGGGRLGPTGWRRANVNALTDMDNRDPLSGFPVFKALLCQVERLDEAR